jgi:glucose-6-phosphate isomerase
MPNATPFAAAPADAALIAEGMERARTARLAERLLAKDPSLFTADPALHEAIRGRLGWVDSPATFAGGPIVRTLEALRAELLAEGCTDLLLMGMGGSSIAPEVVDAVLPKTAAGLRLTVVDSTHPAVLRAAFARDPRTTAVVVSSKSGSTAETRAFAAAARAWLNAAGVDPATRLIGICDPGEPAERMADFAPYRLLLLNDATIGGRYSALSAVGLVPAVLTGADYAGLFESGAAAAEAIADEGESNCGIAVGLAIGGSALAGRRALTIVADRTLAPFGAWLEQLIAESTGKQGRGVLPVDREPTPADAAGYGADRALLVLRTAGSGELDPLIADAVRRGLPLLVRTIGTPAEVGALFYEMEVATAVAGWAIGVNPFDEPDVAAAKAATAAVVAEARGGALPFPAPTHHGSGYELSLPAGSRSSFAPAALRAFADAAAAYLSIGAFLPMTPEVVAAVDRLRAALAARRPRPVTAGFGPRYLHSTGQLHKGGFDGGAFLIIGDDPGAEVAIPGLPYGFGHLIGAQMIGEARTLAARGRRVAVVRLGADPLAGLAAIAAALEAKR